MLDRILRQRPDNAYRGPRIALWLLGLLLALKLLQSLVSVFNAHNTLVTADGIPVDAYPAAAAQTIVGLFALLGRARAFVFLGGVLVLARYRSAIPLMFLVLVLDDVTTRLVHLLAPIPRTGSAPGLTVNLVLAALMVVGLVVSVWPRGPVVEGGGAV
jgi:hypothetical protein